MLAYKNEDVRDKMYILINAKTVHGRRFSIGWILLANSTETGCVQCPLWANTRIYQIKTYIQ